VFVSPSDRFRGGLSREPTWVPEARVRRCAALRASANFENTAPQVVKRITDLGNMIWKLCQEIDSRNPVVDEAKLLLKNRLEIEEAAHRFHSVLRKVTTTEKHS
jgi:hypothetical protein